MPNYEQARTMEIYKFLGMDEVPQKALFNFDIFEHAKGSAEVRNVVRMQPWAEPTPSCPWVCIFILLHTTIAFGQ